MAVAVAKAMTAEVSCPDNNIMVFKFYDFFLDGEFEEMYLQYAKSFIIQNSRGKIAYKRKNTHFWAKTHNSGICTKTGATHSQMNRSLDGFWRSSKWGPHERVKHSLEGPVEQRASVAHASRAEHVDNNTRMTILAVLQHKIHDSHGESRLMIILALLQFQRSNSFHK